MKTWTCYLCGQTGTEPTHHAARRAFTAHYVQQHQEVPF